MRSTTFSSAAGAGGHQLLARRLAVDQVEHLVAVAVLVALGLERLGQRLDQRWPSLSSRSLTSTSRSSSPSNSSAGSLTSSA